MEYKFIITALEVANKKDNLNDVVVTVHYRYNYTLEHYTVNTTGSHTFDIITDSGFIPYDQLNEEIVINWLEKSLEISKLQENLNKQMDELVNPVIRIEHLPFNKPETNITIDPIKVEIPEIEIPVITNIEIELPKP